MKLRLAADDIFIALLKFAGAEIQNKIFTSDREKIHSAMYSLKEKPPRLWQNLTSETENFSRKALSWIKPYQTWIVAVL